MITIFNSLRRAPLCVVGCIGLLLMLAACAPAATSSAGSTKPRVVATTTQVAALARVVGADRIELRGILPANVDPHEYEPTTDDVKAFAKAQVIFINGVGLEAWLTKTIQNSGSQAVVVDTSKGIAIRMVKDQSGKTEADPHIWHSPINAISMLNNIRDGLSAIAPADAPTFRANAAAYEKTLNDLDASIQAQIATIPATNRKVVSNHDTFGYYFDRYGLTLVGSVIPSMDTNFQPSAKELAALVAAIKAQNVKAIFTESSLNPQLAQQIGQEAGVQVVAGALYGDSLGPPGSGADTLDGMLRANTETIVKALGSR